MAIRCSLPTNLFPHRGTTERGTREGQTKQRDRKATNQERQGREQHESGQCSFGAHTVHGLFSLSCRNSVRLSTKVRQCKTSGIHRPGSRSDSFSWNPFYDKLQARGTTADTLTLWGVRLQLMGNESVEVTRHPPNCAGVFRVGLP